MTRPATSYTGWMQANLWSRCARCQQVISQGAWQGLAYVPEIGRRWVHEHCARELGVLARIETAAARVTPASTHPSHANEVGFGGTGTSAARPPLRVPPLRVLVVGSIAWPRSRAVEVRDAIAGIVAVAALAQRAVVLVHGGRLCPDSGRLAGVDAWTELSATRLGLEVTRLGVHPDRHDRAHTEDRHQVLVAAGADVVLAFPLIQDPATGHAVADPVTEDAIARAEAAGLVVAAHPRPAVDDT